MIFKHCYLRLRKTREILHKYEMMHEILKQISFAHACCKKKFRQTLVTDFVAELPLKTQRK